SWSACRCDVARESRFPLAPSEHRRDLRSSAGLELGARRHSWAWADPCRAAGRGHSWNHLCDQGTDGQSRGSGQSALSRRTRHFPWDVPEHTKPVGDTPASRTAAAVHRTTLLPYAGRVESPAHGHRHTRSALRLVFGDALGTADQNEVIGKVRSKVVQTGRRSTCFFLPNDSLMTLSAVRSAGVRRAFSSFTTVSLTRRPPPWIWRRASLLLFTRPARTNAARTPRPSVISAWGTSTVVKPAASAPCSNVARAVSAAASAFSRPWMSAVASVASTFLASFTSAPCRAASLSISSIGNVVNSFKKRPTSPSSVLRQNCQYS